MTVAFAPTRGARWGTEYCETHIDTSLGVYYEQISRKTGEVQTKFRGLVPPEHKKPGVLYESYQVAQLCKLAPVRTYHGKMGDRGKRGLRWRLKLKLLTRHGIDTEWAHMGDFGLPLLVCSSGELEHNSQHREAIYDSYEIEIKFNKKDLFGFPKVYETSGRILRFSVDSEIELQDLHVDKNDCNSCCLGIFPQYRWQGVADFILKKVVPFFYWQSYRRIRGQKPWEGHAHGDRGIEDTLALVSRRGKGRNRNALCYCNSGKKYKKCCYQKDSILRSSLLKVKMDRRKLNTNCPGKDSQ